MREPGHSLQFDWTHANELEITIGGVAYPHLLAHAVLPYSNWEWAVPCQSESVLSLKLGPCWGQAENTLPSENRPPAPTRCAATPFSDLSLAQCPLRRGFPEPEFTLADGFKVTIRRVPQRAYLAVGGSVAPQPESRPESLEVRVLRLLVEGPLAKSELSSGLRQKEISGQLNKVIRLLLADQTVEYTIPEKPTSRLQKYRLTAKGRGGDAGKTGKAVSSLSGG